MIVYTRGRSPNSDQDYRATEQSDFTHLPMVVLVNRNSASASEIVSGALQDHDRALVVGETTFGKALVQSVYRISEQAGLALTTGRYYTPSGRLIQRPWDGTFDEYLTYTLRDQKGAREHNAADLKYTEAGRKVYSGGGIEPDKFMAGPVEGFSPTKFGRQIWGSGQFQRFADQYLAEGDTRFSDANKGKKRIGKGFAVSDEMLQDFRSQLATQKITVDEEAFKTDLTFLKTMIHYEIDLALFGVEEARRNLILQDPQARFGIQQFAEAQRLTELARNTPRNGGR
jgi:carboxyl-terminal processing protease